jgi:nucleoside-diphosphate-sugar epimerase
MSQQTPGRRVLVTGASGFIGYHTLRPLLEAGFQVVATCNKAVPEPIAGVEWIKADLLDESAIAGLVRTAAATHLLHCAWYVEPGKMIGDVLNIKWVQSSLRLLQEFRDGGGTRCVMVGSCYEYDWRYGYCNEELTPAVANTFYGNAKNSLREAFEGYCRATGLSGAWGRAFFLYGPRENPQRLVSSLAKSLLAGKEAPSSHGEQIRDYLHVQDVADALAVLVASDARGTYNIGSGKAATLRTIISLVGQFADRTELLRIGALPARANDTPLVVADIGKIAAATGWKPRIDLESGLKSTVDWWREASRKVAG